jgi:hypothetical protein
MSYTMRYAKMLLLVWLSAAVSPDDHLYGIMMSFRRLEECKVVSAKR